LTWGLRIFIEQSYAASEQAASGNDKVGLSEYIVNSTLNDRYRIAFFVSSHGFGHAARACAVMDALLDLDSTIGFEIFTTIPKWFFEASLLKPFTYHHILTDIGLVQQTPFREDLPCTLKRLEGFYPLNKKQIETTARMLSETGCGLIVCDISPMGIAVGRVLGITSVLIENFTWDWIYEAYTATHPGFEFYVQYLKELFEDADHHIQTEPVCRYKKADLLLPPISRKPRLPKENLLKDLKITDGSPVVMITMGGVPQQYDIHNELREHKHFTFLISGASHSFQRIDNVLVLPFRSDYYHPDLIHASDVVIGKAGYSTVAEVYDAGIPFVFVKRPTFRESETVATFVRKHMPAMDISESQFEDGVWLPHLQNLLKSKRVHRTAKPGARQAAEFIYSLLA